MPEDDRLRKGYDLYLITMRPAKKLRFRQFAGGGALLIVIDMRIQMRCF